MELRDVAEVKAGYPFRRAIVPDRDGNVAVFQARDVVPGEVVTETNMLVRTSQVFPSSDVFLRKGDILLVARGMKSGAFKASLFMSDACDVLASSSVHVIRVTSRNVIIPEYVMHYLNSWMGQNALLQIVSGSYVGAISCRKLRHIVIPVCSLEKQQRIIDLHHNLLEQLEILSRKTKINEEILDTTFNHLTT